MGTVVAASAVGPFWTTYPTLPLAAVTLGRVALLFAGLATVVLVVMRAPRCPPPWSLVAFLGGLGALWIVITVSAATRGCFCAGAWPGYSELAILAGLVAICACVMPRLRAPLLAAALTGAIACALLGLFGVVDIHQSTMEIAPFAGRIGGPFGNPNFLGFAISVGVPIAAVALVRGSWVQRGAALACLPLMAAAIVETYSRGAILAAVAGTLVAVTLLPTTPRRRLAVFVGGVALSGGIGLATYHAFNQMRTNADFAGLRARDAVHDRSGWDGAARGLIRVGPSALSNPAPGVLMATTGGADRGLSLDLGAVPAGESRRVNFEAASSTADVPIAYGIEDDRTGIGPTVRAGTVSPHWRRFSVAWTPRSTSAAARFYIWQTANGADLRLRGVSVVAPRRSAAPALKLSGPASTIDAGEAARIERHYVDSRISAARLGIDAFVSAPVLGIGWERFPGYAQQRDPTGALATHDEYVRVAAELGLLGVVPLLGVLGTVALGALRLVRRRSGAAVVGGVVTAGVGLLFVNGLETPSASSALAVVAALAATATPWRAAAGAP